VSLSKPDIDPLLSNRKIISVTFLFIFIILLHAIIIANNIHKMVASKATFGGGEMLDKKLWLELQEYIWTHQNEDILEVRESILYKEAPILQEDSEVLELEEFIKNNRRPTLQQVLFEYIDRKGVKDSIIYKKAGMDRKHFSKIRSNADYRPKKTTVVSLAFALELDGEETEDLLGVAGYSLSGSDTYDLVIRFFLEKRIHDLDRVNDALDEMKLKTLGGMQ
jgi:hypothetical protein